MSISNAKKEANARYDKKNYSILAAKVKISERKVIDEYCKKMGISKARFIVWACNDFIKRGELPPESVVTSIEEKENGEE